MAENDTGAQDEGAGDAAAAFEALRQTIERRGAEIGAEMTVIRKGVEAAFDRFDRIAVPPDYGVDLGRIVQQLGTMTERLAGIEQLPVLRQGADHYARTIECSGADLVHTAVQALERKANGLEQTQRQLSGYMQSARDAQAQRRQVRLTLTFGVLAGLVLGVAAPLFLPRILPAPIGAAVATTAMGEANSWTAGGTLMQAYNADRYRQWLYANGLVQANAEAINGCFAAAQQTGKGQKCTINVTAPE